jgi:hypothetical protein
VFGDVKTGRTFGDDDFEPYDPPAARSGACDIFLCHRGTEKKLIAEPFFESLSAAGYKVFFDQDMTLGSNLHSALASGLHACKHAIVLLSTQFFDSAWCVRELATLLQRKELDQIKIVPVFCGVDPTQLLRFAPTAHKTLATQIALISGISLKVGTPVSDVIEKVLSSLDSSAGAARYGHHTLYGPNRVHTHPFFM